MLLPYMETGRIEAGCDEAGRGCLAGAVFAAAVILPDGYDHGRKRAALVPGGQLSAGNDPNQLRAQGGRRRGHQL